MFAYRIHITVEPIDLVNLISLLLQNRDDLSCFLPIDLTN